MEWLNADVRAVNAAFQEAPEVFQAVSVDSAIHVRCSMVNLLVFEFIQAVIGLEGIGVQRGTSLDMLADFRLKRFLLPVRDNGSANFTAALQDSHDSSFVFAARPGNPA